ncbi:hypothetical protein NIASO_08705 [Niabella soli DSM 19437]|uniref:Uncharacterized protein n=1 Tax=Niabella soli DSM 19437 TaxID=929713 RepID=W0F7Q0_9BACT|nr:hypothetical protein NIASO_08705 [Niabella soli DSM 19437]
MIINTLLNFADGSFLHLICVFYGNRFEKPLVSLYKVSLFFIMRKGKQESGNR